MFPTEAGNAAHEIIKKARENPHLKEPVVELIKQYGLEAAAEAILVLVEVRPLGANTPYRPTR
jgi:hypothetical protein